MVVLSVLCDSRHYGEADSGWRRRGAVDTAGVVSSRLFASVSASVPSFGELGADYAEAARIRRSWRGGNRVVRRCDGTAVDAEEGGPDSPRAQSGH